MTTPESPEGTDLTEAPAMSLGGRLATVFVAPGEVFDEVKNSPPTMSNWLVPMIVGIVVGIIYSMVVFSQPTVMQAMRAPVEKKIQQMVDSGKITQQIADKQLEGIEKIMTSQVFQVVGILFALFGSPAMTFFVALIVWLVGKYALGGDFIYMKAVEGTGLAGFVMVPWALVTMLLAVIYGSIYMTAGPILLAGHFDQSNLLDRVLSATDIGTIWWVVTLSIALARLSGSTSVKAALWGFGFWAVFKLGPALVFGGQ